MSWAINLGNPISIRVWIDNVVFVEIIKEMVCLRFHETPFYVQFEPLMWRLRSSLGGPILAVVPPPPSMI